MEDRAFKSNTTRPLTQHCKSHHITMQRHLDQVRQQERETLKLLNKRRERTTPMRSPKKQIKKNIQLQRKSLRKVSLLDPETSSVTGPSSETNTGAAWKDRRELMQMPSTGQYNTRKLSNLSPIPMMKIVHSTIKDTTL